MAVDAYCDFCASFRIIDAANLHTDITSHLVKPSSIAVQGDPVPHLRDRKVSHDMWVLDPPLAEDLPWGEHLRWLEETLRPKMAYLKSLRDRDIEMDFFLGFRTNQFQSEFQIPPGTTDFASTLGIPLQVSVIVI